MIRKLAIAVLALAFCGLPDASAAGEHMDTQISPEEQEVRNVLLEIIDRFNRHEVRPPDNPTFTKDADFINVEGTWMSGLDEISRVNKMSSTAWLKDAKITLIKLDIRFIRPDVVIAHQLHEMTGSRHSDGTALPPHRQLSTRVMVKEQGKWMTTAFQNMIVGSTVPPAPTQ